VALFIATLVNGQGSVEGPLVDAILGALAAVARDDPGRIVIQEAGGVPLIIKLMDGPPDVVRFAPPPPGDTHIYTTTSTTPLRRGI